MIYNRDMRFVVSAACAALALFIGFIGWADTQYVCPDGNQCSDATSTMWLSLAMVFTLLLAAFLVTHSPGAKHKGRSPNALSTGTPPSQLPRLHHDLPLVADGDL
jgi:TRAP-type C4-dicarboxylate transport system permease small subunit